MLNVYTLSHVMRGKVFVFGKVKTSNVIKDQNMQPNRQTKSKANRTIKSTPIVDFTECNKECTYYYNVAKYNAWEKHIWTQLFWKKELQRNDRLQVHQPFGFYFDEDIIDLDLLIHDLQYILCGDIITLEPGVDEGEIEPDTLSQDLQLIVIEQVPILEENTLNEYDEHNVGSNLLRITGQCISTYKSYILQVLRYLMMIIGTLILTDTNKEVYKHVLKHITRLLIVHLILTPYCYNGQMEMGKWAIGNGLEIDKWKWIRTNGNVISLSMTVRRKHDIQRKQFIDKGKVIYELRYKYAM